MNVCTNKCGISNNGIGSKSANMGNRASRKDTDIKNKKFRCGGMDYGDVGIGGTAFERLVPNLDQILAASAPRDAVLPARERNDHAGETGRDVGSSPSACWPWWWWW